MFPKLLNKLITKEKRAIGWNRDGTIIKIKNEKQLEKILP